MVEFDPVTYPVNEGEQAFIIAVLNFAADRDVTVDFATSDSLADGNQFHKHPGCIIVVSFTLLQMAVTTLGSPPLLPLRLERQNFVSPWIP